MSGGKIKKLTVVSCDEVHHPTVKFAKKTSANDNSPSSNATIDLTAIDKPAQSEVLATTIASAREQAEQPISTTLPENTEPEEASSPSKDYSITTPQRQRRRRRSLVWTSKLGTLATMSIMIIAITLAALRLAGFRIFTVLSGSMEPNLPVGSMIYVRPIDYQDLKVGDIISYVVDDNKTVVTHRITEIETDPTDTSVRRFKTKGDANDSADSKLVHYKNVLGVPIIILPLFGYFVHNIQEPPGLYITLVVGTLLLAWTFLPGTLEERRKTAKKYNMTIK